MAGDPLGTIPDTKPTVEVVDFQWRTGQKLKSYEIIAEAPPPQGQGPRTFTVRLTLGQGRSRLAFPVMVVLMVVGVGCSGAQRNEDFVPSEEVARSSLDASLRMWASGDTGQLVPDAKPAIMSSDGHRTPTRKLTAYTILGEVPSDAPRCFAVKLTLGNPTAEIRERYVVVGIDPIWVIRYEDYEMLTHWSHPMTAEKKSATSASKK